MSELLQYDFIKRAFLAGFMLSIIIPIIGTVVVNRKTSTVGDALSHTTLSGLFFGTLIGINPMVSGIIISILAAFLIEYFRAKFPKNGDMATAIVMSLGVGLSSLLSDMVTGAQNFESFLFGSIVSVTHTDIIMIAVTSILTILVFIYLYQGLLFIAVDKTSARMAGVKIRLVNYVFTFLLALVIAISSRVVGILIVSSLMILPVASSMYLCRNYKQTVVSSIIFGIIYFTLGLIIAAIYNLKPGGSIILVSVVGLLFILIIKRKEI